MWKIIFDIRDIIRNNHLLRLFFRSKPIRPPLTFGDGDTGIYCATDDKLVISINGTKRFTFTQTEL